MKCLDSSVMGCLFGKEDHTVEGDRPLAVTSALLLEDVHLSPGVFIKVLHGAFRRDYSVLKVLGQGSFGRVYSCRHKSTGVLRAIKEIPRDKNIQTDDDRVHFLKEVEILAKVDHPHIAKVYELYENPYCFAVVSELVAGGQLFDYIVKVDRLTESMAASVMLQLLSALRYLHKCEIVHRDLKPENILMDQVPTSPDDISLKLIDFGASATRTKGLHTVIGSLHYLAPEVYTMNYNEKCDIWSAGCVLYVLLSGTMPFQGETEDELIATVKRGEVDLTGGTWSSVSKEAKDFLRALLNKNRTIRLSAEQALGHPWLRKFGNAKRVSMHEAALAVDSLKFYSSRSKLHSAISLFVTTYVISMEEKQRLSDIFTSLDTDHNGVLTRAELVSGLKELKSEEDAEEMVDRIVDQVDLNHSGTVDYTEFLAAALAANRSLSDEVLRKAFDLIDTDGNGKLDSKELKALLGEGLLSKETLWMELLQAADKNGDGVIDIGEFIQLMRNNYM